MRSMVFIALATALALTACSKKDSDAAADTSTNNQAAQTQADSQQPRTPPLAKANKSTPLDQYKELASGKDLMFIYLAASTLPVDYESVAKEISQDYQSSNDEFKKRDLLNALRPAIDAEISKYKEWRYYYIDIEDRIDPYNFEIKAFPIPSLSDKTRYRYFTDIPRYSLAFSNTEEYKNLPVADENAARAIEALRSRYERTWRDGYYTRIYFFVTGTELGQPRVLGEITKLQLYDKNNTLMAEL